MSGEPVTALLTCVGGALSGAVIRALKDQADLPLRIIGVDCDGQAPGRDVVDVFYRVPAGIASDYTSQLLQICERERVRVILPGSDEEVEAIAKARQAFEQVGVHCAVPAYDTVRLLRHKGRLLERLAQASFEVTPFCEVTTPEALRESAQRLGYPGRALVVKPCLGRGGRGMVVLDEQAKHMDALFLERDQRRMRLQELLALWPRDGDVPPLLVMEYLSGDTYDVDVLSRSGAVVCLTIRRRYNKRGIPFTGCITERHEGIEQHVRAVVALLQLDACADIDLVLTEHGEPQILEINPRLSGSVIGAVSAGINYPLEAIRMALGLPVVARVGQPGVETLPVLQVQSRTLEEPSLVRS